MAHLQIICELFFISFSDQVINKIIRDYDYLRHMFGIQVYFHNCNLCRHYHVCGLIHYRNHQIKHSIKLQFPKYNKLKQRKKIQNQPQQMYQESEPVEPCHRQYSTQYPPCSIMLHSSFREVFYQKKLQRSHTQQFCKPRSNALLFLFGGVVNF